MYIHVSDVWTREDNGLFYLCPEQHVSVHGQNPNPANEHCEPQNNGKFFLTFNGRKQ
jgi:hypothetical protein